MNWHQSEQPARSECHPPSGCQLERDQTYYERIEKMQDKIRKVIPKRIQTPCQIVEHKEDRRERSEMNPGALHENRAQPQAPMLPGKQRFAVEDKKFEIVKVVTHKVCSERRIITNRHNNGVEADGNPEEPFLWECDDLFHQIKRGKKQREKTNPYPGNVLREPVGRQIIIKLIIMPAIAIALIQAPNAIDAGRYSNTIV